MLFIFYIVYIQTLSESNLMSCVLYALKTKTFTWYLSPHLHVHTANLESLLPSDGPLYHQDLLLTSQNASYMQELPASVF